MRTTSWLDEMSWIICEISDSKGSQPALMIGRTFAYLWASTELLSDVRQPAYAAASKRGFIAQEFKFSDRVSNLSKRNAGIGGAALPPQIVAFRRC